MSSPVSAAVMCNSVEVLQILLQARANPDTANEYGETPLSIAEMQDAHSAVAKILREHGAKVKIFHGRLSGI
jgi:ankyrin repeat protein